MIDFTTVTREFRGLVDRRREMQTFLGSTFAAMGLFLANVLQGKLPPSLHAVQEHIFAFYAFILMVISLLLALRMARLHGGMVLNGVLYARLMQEQDFTHKRDPVRSTRHNYFGVSFIQFVMLDFIAAFSLFLLLLALNMPTTIAVVAAAGVFLCWMVLNFRFHQSAAEFGLKKIAEDPVGPVNEEEWREHISLSLQQANHGLMGEIAFAGLMVFSCFGAMSGLGSIVIKDVKLDFGVEVVKQHGPLFYAVLMVVICFLELAIYLRVRVAIGHFSLQLDPTDHPFRPFRLTDSLLGYMMLAFLFCVALHMLLVQTVPALGESFLALIAIDGLAFFLAVCAEQATLMAAASHVKR